MMASMLTPIIFHHDDEDHHHHHSHPQEHYPRYSYSVHISDNIYDRQHPFGTHALCSHHNNLSFPQTIDTAHIAHLKNNPDILPLLLAPISFKTTHSRTRSLTDPPFLAYDEMTTFAQQAPGSPPELTSSKSSKSSSFHSSSIPSADGTLSDLAHFEDIGLSDEHPTSVQDLYGHNRLSIMVPSFRKIPAAIDGNRSQAASNGTLRELTNGVRKPSYPPLNGQVRPSTMSGPPLSLNSRGPGVKRGSTIPSSPSLAMVAMRNRSRSRSPSPKHPQQALKSSGSIATGTPSLQPSASLDIRRSTSRRRSSWQPSRKTAKELEDEYHDSDEDLPDDASLWNVPLSPGLYRTTSTAVSSANASANTSPERPSHLNLSLGRRPSSVQPPRTAPVISQSLSSTLMSMPSSPIKPKIPRGMSTGTMPDQFYFPKNRAKSWNVALSDLSEEAKSLSEALEAHAEDADRQQEEAVQSGTLGFKPNNEKLTRSKTSIVELPPLRKSEIMIDPLPISKEKEKVLSRTRPSWLPPKNRKEERKHLKEYQRMMELSIEADKKKAAKAASVQCARDDTKTTLLRIWEEHVLPNWSQALREPRTRELWWRGIAPRSRAEVWRRAIGNELGLTDATYTKALQRAKNVEKDFGSRKGEQMPKEKSWFEAIGRDVNVTFPDLKLFQPGGPLHNSLLDVLKAYSMYRSDVGYCHGTHLPAALLLLTLHTPAHAFSTLANLLNRPLHLAFLTGDKAGTDKTYALTLSLLEKKFPKLYSHLFGADGLGLRADELLEPMIRTLFMRNSCKQETLGNCSSHPSSYSSPSATIVSGAALPLEHALRVWDVLVFDGDAMIIRTCVGILGCLESRLYGSREEVLAVLGWERRGGGGEGDSGMWGDEEVFMGRIRGCGKV